MRFSSCLSHCTYFVLHKYIKLPLIIEHWSIAREESFVYWLVLPFRERNNFIQLSKNISLYRFSTHEITFFSQFQPQVFLKIFFKFRKFQPRYSYKIYSYKKERVCSAVIAIQVKLVQLLAWKFQALMTPHRLLKLIKELRDSFGGRS